MFTIGIMQVYDIGNHNYVIIIVEKLLKPPSSINGEHIPIARENLSIRACTTLKKNNSIKKYLDINNS